MNEVPIIRKGSYKKYLTMALRGGLVVGIIFFFMVLLKQPILYALLAGLGIWATIIIIFMGIIYPGYEYFGRKKKIKKCRSKKYSFLYEASFSLYSDLFFEGIYKGYFIMVFPVSKRLWINAWRKIEFDIIVALYTFDSENNEKKEESLTGDYFFGDLYFSNHLVEFYLNDWENPDFKSNLDGLVSILKREDLKPISKEDWEKSFGTELTEQYGKKEKKLTS